MNYINIFLALLYSYFKYKKKNKSLIFFSLQNINIFTTIVRENLIILLKNLLIIVLLLVISVNLIIIIVTIKYFFKKFKKFKNLKVIIKNKSYITLFINDESFKFFKDYIETNYLDNYNLITFDRKNPVETLILFQKYKKYKNAFIGEIPNEIIEINPKNTYYINTEQLTDEKRYNDFKKILKASNIKFFDYSLENINILDRFGVKSTYLPYKKNPNEIYNFPKIYDVAIIQPNRFRRWKIYYLLKSKGIKINIIKGWNFEDRDRFLFQHKILLNIHFKESYKIYEEIRCNRCTFNGMIVLTETSLNLKNYYKYYHNIIETDYDNLVNKAIYILQNYDKVKSICYT